MIYAGKRQVLGAFLGTKKVNKMFLGDAVMYAPAQPVTYVFDGVTTTAPSTAPDGEPFAAPLFGTSGKAVLPDSVRVEMGGEDITATAFNLLNNTVEIDEVIAPITITAEGVTAYEGYTPLAYIACVVCGEKGGISLGFKPTNKTKIHAEFMVTGGSKEYMMSEYNIPRTSTHYCSLWQYSSKLVFAWGGTNSASFTPVIPNNKRASVIIDQGLLSYTWDGEDETHTNDMRSASTFSGGANLYLFGNKRVAASGCCRGNIYRYRHWEDGVFTRDLVPCREEATGEVGIINTLSGYFSNSIGAGDLYIGPYVASTNTLVDCSIARKSGANTGTTTQAVIGSDWSVELTPSAGYTFGTSQIVVTIGGVDKTSEVASYDSSTGKWTIAINNVPMKPITITATAHAAAA